MKIKSIFSYYNIIFVITLIIIFFIHRLNIISYGLPFFYNQDEIAFQGSTLSSLSFLTGYFELNYNPYYAPLLNLLIIIKSIIINEFFFNSLSLDQIKSKIYFNPELFLFYGRVASLIITSISIFFLYLIFKKLKINFLIYSTLLITFATSMEAMNVSTQMGKNSANLLIYLIQIYFLFKYLLKPEKFQFNSYLIFSLLASFAWGVNYWPAFVSIYAIIILHYQKFKFSKIQYIFSFFIVFIIFGPILNSFFINYPPIDHLLPDKDLEKFQFSQYMNSFINDFVNSFKIIFFTEKNIILLALISPFFLLNKSTKFKKEFFIIFFLILAPIILFSIGDDIPAQLRYFAGIISVVLILIGLIFNEFIKLNNKYLIILLVISNLYFIYKNIEMDNMINKVIAKKHTFYNFNNKIDKDRSKILYMVDLNIQESLDQNLYYIKLFENGLIKENKDTKNYLKNIQKKINILENSNNINKKDLKKDITYFNYTYFPINDMKLFFDFVRNDFEYVLIEETKPFYLSDEFLQKEIKSYVKGNFLFDQIHISEEKIFLRDQQAIIHYYTGSLSRFDTTKNIYNDELEVIYGSNYSLYKLN